MREPWTEGVWRLWCRLTGEPRHREAAVALDAAAPALAVLFRGLGGAAGIRLAAATPPVWAVLDGAVLRLPARIDLFPEAALNATLYEWLVAFFAQASPPLVSHPADPLQADIAFLCAADAATRQALAVWPALSRRHDALARALRARRPPRPRPHWEAAVEAAVIALLGGPEPDTDDDGRRVLAAVRESAVPLDAFAAPSGYRRFRRVPLWGAVAAPPDAVVTPAPAGWAPSDWIDYPEWDSRRGAYRPEPRRVLAGPASEPAVPALSGGAAPRRLRLLRRRFESLDSGRVWPDRRRAARDLAVAVLLEAAPARGGGWPGLDLEKQILTALGHGLAAAGDDLAVFAFAAEGDRGVRVQTLKDFGEPMAAAARRIRALEPGRAARPGAALRHAAARLSALPSRHRLILLLTGGGGENPDAAEDARVAVRETHRRGVAVFGIALTAPARHALSAILGRGAYTVLPHASRLATTLPALWRRLVG